VAATGSRLPAYSDPLLVPALFSLASAAALLPPLKTEAWRSLVTWLPLFAHCAPDIQMQLLAELKAAARAKADLFRGDIGVDHLVEALRLWYGMACVDVRVAPTLSSSDFILGRPTHAATGAAAAAPARSGGTSPIASPAPPPPPPSMPSTPSAVAAAVAAAVGAAAPLSPHAISARAPAYLPFVPADVRRELLREFLRVIGCALDAAEVVLQPAELASSLVGGSMTRRSGGAGRSSVAVTPTRAVGTRHVLTKAEVGPLVSLLADDWTAVIPGCADGDGGETAVELFQAEILSLVSALLDFDASHVAGDAGDVLVSAAVEYLNRATDPNAAAFSAETLEVRVLDAVQALQGSPARALAALDAAVEGDFVGFLLFRLIARGGGPYYMGAALRALFYALRANAGRPGRLGDAAAPFRTMRTLPRTGADRDRVVRMLDLVALPVGAPAAGGAAWSPPPQLAAASHAGAYWSADFTRAHGYEILYYALRDQPALGASIYAALIEAAVLPDCVEWTTSLEVVEPAGGAAGMAAGGGGSSGGGSGATGGAGSGTSGGGGGGGGDDWSTEARSVGLLAALGHTRAHAILGGRVWFKNSRDVSCRLAEDTLVAAPEVLRVILRLLPHLPRDVAARALADLSTLLRTNDANRKVLYNCVMAWDVLLFEFLLGLAPTAYPPRDELRNLPGASRGPAEGATVASTPSHAGAHSHSGHGGHGHVSTNALYAAGEDLLLFLLRAGLNGFDGWRHYQHLLALQPMLSSLRGTPGELAGGGEGDGTGGGGGGGRPPASLAAAILRSCGTWNAVAATRSANHGKRLLTLALAYAFDDFDVRRTRAITKAHIENLVHLTVLVDRLVAVTRTAAAPDVFAPSATPARPVPPPTAGGAAAADGGASGSSVSVVALSSTAPAGGRSRTMSLSAATYADDLSDFDAGSLPLSARPDASPRAAAAPVAAPAAPADDDAWDRDGVLRASGMTRPAHREVVALPPDVIASLLANGAVLADLPGGAAAAGGGGGAGIVAVGAAAAMAAAAATTTPSDSGPAGSTVEDAAGAAAAATTTVAARVDAPPPVSDVEAVAAEEAARAAASVGATYAGVLATKVVAMWDRLMAPALDKAERFNTMTCNFLAAGNLRVVLLSLSVWVVRQFPVWSPEAEAALRRMSRLLPALYTEVGPKVKRGIALVAGDSSASASSSGSGRSESRARRPSVSSSDDDWVDMAPLGRPAVTAEQWVLTALTELHDACVRLQGTVAVALAEAPASAGASAGAEPPAGSAAAILPGCERTATVALALLRDIHAHCFHAADVALLQVPRFVAFLDAYTAAQRRSAAAGSGSTLAWEWLLAGTEPGSTSVGAGASAGAGGPHDARSSSWVRAPAWSRAVGIAREAVAVKTGEAADEVDAMAARTWVGVVRLLRENMAVLKPLLQEAVAAVQERTNNALSRAAWEAVDRDAEEGGGEPLRAVAAAAGAAAQLGRRALHRISTVRKTLGGRLAAAIAGPEGLGVSGVEGDAGGASVGDIGPVAEGDDLGDDGGGDSDDGHSTGSGVGDGGGSDVEDAGGQQQRGATSVPGVTTAAGHVLALRTDLPTWVPPALSGEVGHVRMRVPPWYNEWLPLHSRARDRAAHLSSVFATRHAWGSRRREDVLGCMRRTHTHVMHALSLQGGAWAGDG